ncbi:C39 family peptidase [Salidesulfovibrio onnuriiensis]|uniref:C39 family peptidase n=1 Tax=Salidesulfovibrio onnuriiensis TaxID=2583823 RepID=UPI0011C6F338|nr:C39 family peptidase [Salidesulfovibrio onnuriiensis]
MIRPRSIATMLGLLCLLAGCAAAKPTVQAPTGIGSNMVANVPFHPQEDHQCGPSSLAMVLNHAGDNVTPEEIAQSIFRKNIRGTVSLDMALYPRNRGFNSRFGKGDPQGLVQAVDANKPAVVMVNQGFAMARKLHYMVVTGYTPDFVVVNSGRERNKRIAWDEFLTQWRDTGFWMLTVQPRSGS